MRRFRVNLKKQTIMSMPLLWVGGLAVMVMLTIPFEVLSFYEGIQILLMYTLV